MTLVYLVGGLLLLFVGGEALLRGAVSLGKHLGFPPFVIGMVIVGFGTSLPELVVSLEATLRGASSMAVGNVIGSNISNILLILPVAALIRPIGKPARLMVPDGFVLLGVSLVVVLVGLQDPIPAWQGLILVALLLSLVVIEYLRARKETALQHILTQPIILPEEVPHRPLVALLLVCTGIAVIVYGADLLVEGAVRTARLLGVSEGLIGLTIIAVGTSLPELASSIVASWRGHSEVSYGNIVGSNLFNLLGVLGAAIIAGPVHFPGTMLVADGPVMIGVTLLMLLFLSTGRGLSRPEAALMLVAYVSYVGLRFAYGLYT